MISLDIAVKATGNGSNALALPSLTTGGSNRIIIVTTHTSNSSAISSITATGLTFSQVTSLSLGGNGLMEVWVAFATSSFSGVITVNSTGFPQISAVAAAYSGGSMSGLGTSNGTASSGTSPSTSLTTTANNSLVVGGIALTASGTISPGSNQTEAKDASGVLAFSGVNQQLRDATTPTAGTSVTINGTTTTSSNCGAIAVEILDGGSTEQSVNYYFNANNGDATWDANANNVTDGVTTTYGTDNDNGSTLTLTGNTCPGTNLGTITKVEIRQFALKNSSTIRADITPKFGGSSSGTRFDWGDWMSTTGAYSAWHDITTDTNAPGTWTWADVQNLDALITVNRPGSGQVSLGQVEIRVTYNLARKPRMGFVNHNNPGIV